MYLCSIANINWIKERLKIADFYHHRINVKYWKRKYMKFLDFIRVVRNFLFCMTTYLCVLSMKFLSFRQLHLYFPNHKHAVAVNRFDYNCSKKKQTIFSLKNYKIYGFTSKICVELRKKKKNLWSPRANEWEKAHEYCTETVMSTCTLFEFTRQFKIDMLRAGSQNVACDISLVHLFPKNIGEIFRCCCCCITNSKKNKVHRDSLVPYCIVY